MQPKISFQQLNTNTQSDINKLICDICYNSYTKKRHILVLCTDTEHLSQLDEYIINYQKKYFFPYSILNEGPIPPPPITLTTESTNKLKHDILLNLHSIIPDNFIKYREIIELVPCDEQDRTLTREHYKHYKKHKLNIEFAEVNKVEEYDESR